jgi:phage baseplate assembly protein gpV
MSFASDIWRELEALRRGYERLRHGLVRVGTVQSVDTTACTAVVRYLGEDAKGQPWDSHPMPWLQRSTEHRPPAAGDHALVLDPSLGNGGALVICGWPSTAKPAPSSGGAKDVIFRQRGGDHADTYDAGTRTIKAAKIVGNAPAVELGESPSDFAALAQKVDTEIMRIWDVLTAAGIVPAPATTTTPPDAGEPGLITLKSMASTAKAAVQSVAAAQVKVK